MLSRQVEDFSVNSVGFVIVCFIVYELNKLVISISGLKIRPMRSSIHNRCKIFNDLHPTTSSTRSETKIFWLKELRLGL